ncbi:MAG: 6-phosphofructokinase [Anaerolineae bacterium]
MRTLFVVSGGDAPGINSLIGQYCHLAAANGGDTVWGANGGFPGLLDGKVGPLDYSQLVPWMGRGGSILPSSRDPVLSQADAGERIQAVLLEYGIDNLVMFGGNGSLRHIPPLLREWSVPCIGVPTTIDNDVPGTEMTLGFDSACNYAYQAIDGAMTTAHALHGRLFMVETLGGTCGNLALAVAQGAGAHAVIVPEYNYDEHWLGRRMKQAVEIHGFGLMVICEGARGARTLADDLPKLTGIRMRDVRLGHAQRGGNASHRDRVLAAEMAYMAYHALKDGEQQQIIVVRGSQLLLEPELLTGSATPPAYDLYKRINGLEI